MRQRVERPYWRVAAHILTNSPIMKVRVRRQHLRTSRRGPSRTWRRSPTQASQRQPPPCAPAQQLAVDVRSLTPACRALQLRAIKSCDKIGTEAAFWARACRCVSARACARVRAWRALPVRGRARM
eukprot:5293333-Pleurochrysis_carterae.AAC.3